MRAAPEDQGEPATQPGTPASEGDPSVPISVRLGTVVPPEDPEDWRRPLTWVAAAGMLLGPLVAFGWFTTVPPDETARALLGTWMLAAALVVGAVATGSTQLEPVWAFAGTLGAGLFGALLTIVVGFAVAPATGAGAASPPVVHAVLASVAGLTGTVAASTLMPALARGRSRARRGLAPGAIGLAVAALALQLIFSV
ncbi:MAG: hypothetical protein M3P14_01695 [Chloroflexota bacterium]|nr:hypothetical protein [Chloroflexota bacterium]